MGVIMRTRANNALTRKSASSPAETGNYGDILKDIVGLLETARHASARAVNAVMTATYWEIGRRIVELEQGGLSKAPYGEKLLLRLGDDLTSRFGKGFSKRNLEHMRQFYLCWPIAQTLSAQLSKNGIFQTLSGKLTQRELAQRFALPWSHYIRLLSVEDSTGRSFYEAEALRGGWSVRQLDRQISTKFFERALLSRNKAAMLKKAETPLPQDQVTPEEEIKDPFVLEFLGLKDEYSETEMEEALIRNLESFLLELGGDFAFIGRHRRLRVGNEWYRVDLLFFHRRLRCLVIIDLKVGKFTHADAGQMHLYLNYAREHWTNAGENPPVGLILCSEKDAAVAHYALEGLPNKVLAAEYRMRLPEEKTLIGELERTRKQLLLHASFSEAGKK
jgi:predicted nuclease of restriction endonuclease-like (RecB) superfamily